MPDPAVRSRVPAVRSRVPVPSAQYCTEKGWLVRRARSAVGAGVKAFGFGRLRGRGVSASPGSSLRKGRVGAASEPPTT